MQTLPGKYLGLPVASGPHLWPPEQTEQAAYMTATSTCPRRYTSALYRTFAFARDATELPFSKPEQAHIRGMLRLCG